MGLRETNGMAFLLRSACCCCCWCCPRNKWLEKCNSTAHLCIQLLGMHTYGAASRSNHVGNSFLLRNALGGTPRFGNISKCSEVECAFLLPRPLQGNQEELASRGHKIKIWWHSSIRRKRYPPIFNGPDVRLVSHTTSILMGWDWYQGRAKCLFPYVGPIWLSKWLPFSVRKAVNKDDPILLPSSFTSKWKDNRKVVRLIRSHLLLLPFPPPQNIGLAGQNLKIY